MTRCKRVIHRRVDRGPGECSRGEAGNFNKRLLIMSCLDLEGLPRGTSGKVLVLIVGQGSRVFDEGKL